MSSVTTSTAASTGARWVLIATVLGSSMEFIDGTVVNLSLPSLQHTFNATGTQVQWIVEGYALFLASLLLVGGSFGDRFGLRKTFLAGVVLFACASILCGVSTNIAMVIAARCLQGIGGALLVPNSLALLSSSFSEAERGRAIGTWSGYASMMTALGPVLGGWLVQHGGWRWVFFLNAPIALATLWITLRKTSAMAPTTHSNAPVDIPGALLATAGLSALTFSLLDWSTGNTFIHLAAALGVALLVAFVLFERKAAAPMMPLDIFRSRSFTGANLVTLFLYASLAMSLFYLPLNLIQVQGYTPTQAGATMLPFVLLMFFLSRWAGGLIERYGPRLPLIVGPCLTGCGYLLLARPGLGGNYWTTYFPATLVLGFGMTVSVAPLTTVVMSSVPNDRTGAASGVNNAITQTAMLLSLAITAPLFFHQFSSELAHRLATSGAPQQIAQQVLAQKQHLGAILTQDADARRAINGSFVAGFRLIAILAAAAAIAAAITAALTIRTDNKTNS